MNETVIFELIRIAIIALTGWLLGFLNGKHIGLHQRDERATKGILYINYEHENASEGEPYIYMGLYDSIENVQQDEYVKMLVEVVKDRKTRK